MRTKTITLYTFDELSDDAKERAREWFREASTYDEWWENVYEHAAQIAKILGIDINQKPVKLMGGSTRYDPSIWFQGFYCQGSGSSFDGTYSYRKGSVKEIKEYAPTDTELHSIATALSEAQRKNRFSLTAKVSSCRDTSIHVEVDDDNGTGSADVIVACMEDFNHWIFSQLEKEYEYQNSDEVVDDTIRANEYTFDVDGNRED